MKKQWKRTAFAVSFVTLIFLITLCGCGEKSAAEIPQKVMEEEVIAVSPTVKENDAVEKSEPTENKSDVKSLNKEDTKKSMENSEEEAEAEGVSEITPQQFQETTDLTQKSTPAPKVPEKNTLPEESAVSKEVAMETQTFTCTISITCGDVLDHLDMCEPSIAAIIPSGGIILPETEVDYSQGESVYDVLQRVCRNNGIPMDSSYSPIYDSAYVKGIANLYEKDVGSTSGWTYWVNGSFPSYGCSAYELMDGDTVEWIYTCG